MNNKKDLTEVNDMALMNFEGRTSITGTTSTGQKVTLMSYTVDELHPDAYIGDVFIVIDVGD